MPYAMNASNEPPMDHDDALMLLPFLVTGALREGERAAVERHVRDCVTCRRELANEKQTQRAFQDLDPVPTHAQHAYQRLLSRISSDAAGTLPSGVVPLPAKAPKVATGRPSRWLSSALAASLGALVLGSLVALNYAPDQAKYRTLSDAVVSAGDLAVVFKGDATSSELAGALRGLDLSIVAGPSLAGAYTLRLAPHARSDLQTALVKLQARADVALAYRLDHKGE